MSIFGCVVSGRLVQTDFQQVGEAQFLITIPDADHINHIVVFLTGLQPLPPDMAGIGGIASNISETENLCLELLRNLKLFISEMYKKCHSKFTHEVYFSWPNPNAPPQWQMLGHISNEKPSAIFKISNLKTKAVDDGINSVIFDQQMSHVAQLGISVEPKYNVKDAPPTHNLSNVVEMSQKVLQHFLNYITSFAIPPSQVVMSSSEMLVPLSKVQNWYSNIERRILQNPDFWRS